MSEPRPPPAFTGLIVHREPRYGCSMLIPEGWERRELVSELGSGAVFLPNRSDDLTSFSFEGRDLGLEVQSGDLAALRFGFLAGLRKLPGARIAHHEADAIGRLITMEARLTFREEGSVRKRWTRLLYQGRVQARLVAQGASAAEFDYWEPMFFQTIRTFRFSDWWADVTGANWTETPFNEDAGRSEGPR
jgi:hypothetical protein